jgi:hypothetical protein
VLNKFRAKFDPCLKSEWKKTFRRCYFVASCLVAWFCCQEVVKQTPAWSMLLRMNIVWLLKKECLTVRQKSLIFFMNMFHSNEWIFLKLSCILQRIRYQKKHHIYSVFFD